MTVWKVYAKLMTETSQLQLHTCPKKAEEELTLTSTCSATVFHMRQKNCLKIYNFSKGNV